MAVFTKQNVNMFMVLLLLLMAPCCLAQEYFPDIPGYKTLICDFHMHTVFSDGLVWPTVRVDEARREGLDAIALSDHIEHQPHKEDIPTNHNRPFEIASENAKKNNILLIKGAEITRDTPPGHYNAVFISDINPLETPDFLKVIKLANEQKGFVFWNHHDWKGTEKGDWKEVQTTMAGNEWLHGMEVANGKKYYPRAHKWCLEKNLTMIGNSDLHHPSIDYKYTPDNHRTLTLVFAKDRSVEAIKAALIARRTVVWHNNKVIGREEYLKPLFNQCVVMSKPHYINKKRNAFFEVENKSLVSFELLETGKDKPKTINLPAGSKIIMKTKMPKNSNNKTLSYTVKNFLVEPEKGLSVEFNISKN